MLELTRYLLCLDQVLSKTNLRQLGIIASAMLCCRARITMLGISRWTGRGGSYRTVQRFFDSKIFWLQVNWTFVKTHLIKEDEVYLLAGDESTVSKSGKLTHGLGKFFSSIHSRAIKGLGFFSLCLIEVSSKKAMSLLMEQLDPKMKRKTKMPKTPKTKKAKGKAGRPVGSKNKNRKNVELTEYLKWIKSHIESALSTIGDSIKIAYFVYDGAFGNNECLQMVNRCGLSLISKLNCNAALYFPYEGDYSGRGPKRKYGEKVNYQEIPEKYLMQTSIQDGIEERIYQMAVWHRDFADQLNVVVIQRKQIISQKVAQVILFSNDLSLDWQNMIHYYRLRFQIEFTFRDAKQFWGLEDFMNVKQVGVENASNLAMFMVNVSRFIVSQFSEYAQSISDLKIRAQAVFYVEELIKMIPEIQREYNFPELKRAMADIGCIHSYKNAA